MVFGFVVINLKSSWFPYIPLISPHTSKDSSRDKDLNTKACVPCVHHIIDVKCLTSCMGFMVDEATGSYNLDV